MRVKGWRDGSSAFLLITRQQTEVKARLAVLFTKLAVKMSNYKINRSIFSAKVVSVQDVGAKERWGEKR